MAAGRCTSHATSNGLRPCASHIAASLAACVVLPLPCRPASITAVTPVGAKCTGAGCAPSSSINPSWTIATTACAGVIDSSTSAPTARSRMRAMKSLTTPRLTSASSSAMRTSRSTSETSASLSLPRERSRVKIAARRSERDSNIDGASAGAGAGRCRARPSRLLADLFDIADRVADRLDLLGLFVWDIEIEFGLESHDELYLVERVRAEVIGDRCIHRHFVLFDAQLFDDGLLHFVED